MEVVLFLAVACFSGKTEGISRRDPWSENWSTGLTFAHDELSRFSNVSVVSVCVTNSTATSIKLIVMTHAGAFTQTILIKYFDKFFVFHILKLYVKLYFVQMCFYLHWTRGGDLLVFLYPTNANGRSFEMWRSFISHISIWIRSLKPNNDQA